MRRSIPLHLLGAALAIAATIKSPPVEISAREAPIKSPKRGSFAEQRIKDKARKMERKTRK